MDQDSVDRRYTGGGNRDLSCRYSRLVEDHLVFAESIGTQKMDREMDIACVSAPASGDFESSLRIVDIYRLADREDIDWEEEAHVALSLLEAYSADHSDSSRAA